MQLIVDNLLIHYQQFGAGRTVLLLHGWTEAAQASFQGLGQALGDQYQVVMPDLPGFGKSGVPSSEWGIPEYADFVKHFLAKIDVQPDFVVAHSNGGTIALYLLGQKMIQSEKLVLLGSAGIRARQALKKSLLRVAAKPVKLMLSPLPRTTQERIKKRAYGQLGSDLYALEHMKPVFKRVVSYDVQQTARLVTQPTLLVYGSRDTSTPPSFGHTFAKIMPHAQLKIIDGAGHYVQLDEPVKTTKLIKGFLA